jgi:GT2 family glycosyltransferase
MQYDLIATVVTYNNPISMLDNLQQSFFKTTLKVKLVFIDNSQNFEIKNFALNNNIEYTDTGANLGFGRAHNMGINRFAKMSDYFLILNPDIIIHEGTLEKLKSYLDQNSQTNLIAPMILNPDGSIQMVHKRLPTFTVLFGRRFLPGSLQKLIQKQLDHYILKDLLPFEKPIEVPIISGCFMFFRSQALLKLQGFDERFFMYMEDFDLSRRSGQLTPNIFYPAAKVTHLWARGSHKSLKLTWINIKSSLQYFWKWARSK